MAKKVLCTGGAGYIGIHTVCRLFEHGYECVIVDNLTNESTSKDAVTRLEAILSRKIKFYEMDVRDYKGMKDLFVKEKFDAVIHYAALKAVGESCAMPIEYYENNIGGLVNILKVMAETHVNIFVFSSSCTVYQPSETPLTEEHPKGASNPYGHTKVFCEQILQDTAYANKSLKVSLLRYFNPVGAHSSGMLGESADHPLNLLPFVQRVALGHKPALSVFGNDWPTADGTGVRDYIHVMDLADGHIVAMKNLLESTEGCCWTHNLGTGQGTSVLELVKIFEEATGIKIPVRFIERRAGDIASAVADSSKAMKEWGWRPTHSLQDACSSAWNWQSKNPCGYPKN